MYKTKEDPIYRLLPEGDGAQVSVHVCTLRTSSHFAREEFGDVSSFSIGIFALIVPFGPAEISIVPGDCRYYESGPQIVPGTDSGQA